MDEKKQMKWIAGRLLEENLIDENVLDRSILKSVGESSSQDQTIL